MICVGLYSGLETRVFTAGEMFTALALFNQLAVCLSVFPVTIPIFIKVVLMTALISPNYKLP